MLTKALVLATVPTTDLERAKRFYGETLGLSDAALDAHGDGVFYRAGDGTMLHVYERPSEPSENTAVTFLVQDLEAVMADLRSRGVAFEEYDMPELKTENGVYSEPNGFKVSWLKDPDGNILSIEQHQGA